MPVDLDVVLTNARLKYPQYRNVPDAVLTKALIQKYPQYIKTLTPYGKAIADVWSGKHDPLQILDPSTSVKALRAKYPELKGSDQDLEGMITGKADSAANLRDRLTEDPNSVISRKPRPFTRAEISEMPKFMQKVASDMNTTLAAEKSEEDFPAVTTGTNVKINDRFYPEFARQMMAHEMTHVYQNMRTKEFTAPESDYSPENIDKTYDYGGLPGLQQAIKDKKTIANFNVEQQAKIVEHYYAAHRNMLSAGKVSAETAADFEEMKKAYGPFIRQLAGVPTDEDLYKPIGAPPPPGVPGYEATGYISGDPNIMDFAVPVSK